MTEVIARIALRYVSGWLILNGFIPDELGNSLMNDPEVLHILNAAFGLGIAAITEAWYFLAKRFGWKT